MLPIFAWKVLPWSALVIVTVPGGAGGATLVGFAAAVGAVGGTVAGEGKTGVGGGVEGAATAGAELAIGGDPDADGGPTVGTGDGALVALALGGAAAWDAIGLALVAGAALDAGAAVEPPHAASTTANPEISATIGSGFIARPPRWR